MMPKLKGRGRKKRVLTPDVDQQTPLERYLTELYDKPGGSGSFGGVKPLLDEIKRQGRYVVSRKQVDEFLKSREEYTLHKPAPKHYPMQTVRVGGINDMHQGDLICMPNLAKHNDGYGYSLAIIDCFTKFAWVVAIKDKTPDSVIRALKGVYGSRDTPTTFLTDGGMEFDSKMTKKWFKMHDIQFGILHGTHKAFYIERFIRTFKGMLFRYLTLSKGLKYVDKIDDLVLSYNSRYHRSIGMRPIDVTYKNSLKVFERMYGSPDSWHTPTTSPTFKVDDMVRISRMKGVFEKGYDETYTREIYKVYKVMSTTPRQYKLMSLNGDTIDGRFYDKELQHVIMKANDVYSIEKVLQRRVNNGINQIFVKWVGWDKTHNQWLNEADVVGINTE